jgi:co-chaperonin GroES (HSP10)
MTKIINVLKDNVLVQPLIIEKIGEFDLNVGNISRSVDHRHNCGTVIAVGVKNNETKIGDIVGYSTLDGVDIVYDDTKYILLSKRETQCNVIGDHETVKFGEHNREDINDALFARQYEGFSGAVV